MLRSLELQARKYPSFGKCIFCGATDDLTDEHIVPEAISGLGEILIQNGSCRKCNNFANEAYEQAAMKADFLPVRHMLQLRRKRRGKKTQPRKMPPVSYTAEVDAVGGDGFDVDLPPENYPPIFQFIVHEPAGILAGIDRSGAISSNRWGLLHLGLKSAPPGRVVTRLPMSIGATERVVAKMAYFYAVAERGLDNFDCAGLLDVLSGRRDDILNFVGSILVPEKLPMLRLHKFYFRKRGELTTVLVHLFASFGGPIHEVVIGKEKGSKPE